MSQPSHQSKPASQRLLRSLGISLGLGYVLLILALPLLSIFSEALSQGWRTALAALTDPEAADAIRLTLLSAIIVVPLNTVFGVAAAWLLSKYRFPGREVLITLIDLPFSVSPVIAGLLFILLLGSRSPTGGWLEAHGIQIIFAKPGVVIATLFVTLPFVVRELLPLMQSLGNTEEEAGVSLGASGWQLFRRVTLPNIRWALLHGVLLCSARALGEYGAASVVAGHIRGSTVTLPIHIEMMFSEYQSAAAFSCAALLTLASLASLVLKSWIQGDR